MIAVIVPAHEEERHIGPCLQAVARAAVCPGLGGEEVISIVVLDACTDNTQRIARQHGATLLRVSARNVGLARAAGSERALAAGARWLAFTDADSLVAPDWLSTQLAHHAGGSDAVCGTVCIADWGDYGERMRQHYQSSYNDADGHQHIHGANLGVSAAAYRRAGGFSALVSSEDVALVKALQGSGAVIAWSAQPRVVTSARRQFRAPDGFGATLLRVEREAQASGAGGEAGAGSAGKADGQ